MSAWLLICSFFVANLFYFHWQSVLISAYMALQFFFLQLWGYSSRFLYITPILFCYDIPGWDEGWHEGHPGRARAVPCQGERAWQQDGRSTQVRLRIRVELTRIRSSQKIRSVSEKQYRYCFDPFPNQTKTPEFGSATVLTGVHFRWCFDLSNYSLVSFSYTPRKCNARWPWIQRHIP